MSAYLARPTVYNGIRFRSRLEARLAERMDGLGMPWTYETLTISTPWGGYIPDFLIDRAVILEAKPFPEERDPRWKVAANAVRWDSKYKSFSPASNFTFMMVSPLGIHWESGAKRSDYRACHHGVDCQCAEPLFGTSGTSGSPALILCGCLRWYGCLADASWACPWCGARDWRLHLTNADLWVRA